MNRLVHQDGSVLRSGGVFLLLLLVLGPLGVVRGGESSSGGFVASKAAWHNVQEVVPAADGQGFRISRVPAGLREKLNPAARIRSYSPAGVELRFNLHPRARSLTGGGPAIPLYLLQTYLNPGSS